MRVLIRKDEGDYPTYRIKCRDLEHFEGYGREMELPRELVVRWSMVMDEYHDLQRILGAYYENATHA